MKHLMKNRRKFLKSASLLVASASAMGYQASHAEGHSIATNKSRKDGALQHNVYFWLKAGITDAEKKHLQKGLQDLVNGIKEVRSAEIGVPADTPSRDVVDKSFGFSLFTWFKSLEDHNVYQNHPVHKKFIEDCSSLWTKVQVYDSQMI
jgi:hypothetical protein